MTATEDLQCRGGEGSQQVPGSAAETALLEGFHGSERTLGQRGAVDSLEQALWAWHVGDLVLLLSSFRVAPSLVSSPP